MPRLSARSSAGLAESPKSLRAVAAESGASLRKSPEFTIPGVRVCCVRPACRPSPAFQNLQLGERPDVTWAESDFLRVALGCFDAKPRAKPLNAHAAPGFFFVESCSHRQRRAVDAASQRRIWRRAAPANRDGMGAGRRNWWLRGTGRRCRPDDAIPIASRVAGHQPPYFRRGGACRARGRLTRAADARSPRACRRR